MKGKFLRRFAAIGMAAAIVVPVPLSLQSVQVEAQTAYQMEALDRGLVAVKSSDGIFLSWRLLGTESYGTSFNVYRNGVKIAGPITDSTNYLDKSGSTSSTYYVTSVVNGVEKDQCTQVTPWGNNYLDVSINKPADTTLSGSTVTYSTNDATVADVDGDGQYEIILKWDPSNSKDNSQSGYTSNVYIDCYELDGTQRWRIDLGKNIRAGAHYTQMMAYDFDGDGKAELALKTADGTVAGDGTVIGDSSKDYRNSKGYILSGPEYLTMFEGATGKILTTIDYAPARGTVKDWGDSYGNRVDRFLAGVAYLDGVTPSLIECRGYYAKSMLVAYKYSNGKLTKQWTFTADGSNNSSYRGQGAHSLSIADVDGDGYDEIVYGSAVIDHNGTGLYTSSNGHGDALHCGDFDPRQSGLEVFMVHETKSTSVEGVQIRNAKTGKTIWSKKPGTDVGRGLILNVGADYYPYVVLSAAGVYDSSGNEASSTLKYLGMNFASYWDGDLYREGLDKTNITKWDSASKSVKTLLSDSNVHSCNSTKATPTLSGDILGDWREEVIWGLNDNSALRIYTTTDVTDSKLYTLMHDRQYREAIAWQNVAYNQPPHTSYYIGEDMSTPTQPSIYTVGASSVSPVVSPSPSTSAMPTSTQIEDGIYMIKNVNSNKYLDVEGGVAANGTNVQQWGASGSASYNSWKIEKVSGDYYRIISQLGDGDTYSLDIEKKSTADGANVEIYQYNGGDNQLFNFTKNSDGSYVIRTKITNSASCIDVSEYSTDSGANIHQYTYNGTTNQHFYLERVGDIVASTTPVTTSEAPVVSSSAPVTTSSAPATSTAPVASTTPAGNLSLVVSGTDQDSTNTITTSFTLTGGANASYDLSKLKLRYYYTSDSTVGESVWLDTAAVQYPVDPYYVSVIGDATASIVAMDSTTSTADHYLEVSFASNQVINENAVLQVNTRICHNDWSNFTQSNDYSYNNAAKVVVMYDGAIINGVTP